jgi:2-polyprenyl-3-methyl-5-hydroxy-6-metoxy-1,4-benzoquinol methylase
MASSDFKKSIEDIAGSYHLGNALNDKIFDSMFHRELANKIQIHLKPGIRVLELGYGEGTVAAELYTSNNVVRTIIEGSSELANRAKLDLGSSAEVVNCLFEEYVPEVPYDLILATNVLEHVSDTSALLFSIHSWLKADGICIVTVPNSESFHRRLAVTMGLQKSTKDLSKRDSIVGHLRVYDLAGLLHEIRANNFQVLKIRGMVLKFLNNALQLDMPLEITEALHKIADEYPPEYAANLYVEISKC